MPRKFGETVVWQTVQVRNMLVRVIKVTNDC